MTGVQIGVYRVVRQIGEGGMGAVWLAEHVMLGRSVAIKVLHREASLRPELVQRFFNEAKAATAISDPGIIQIFDFGHHSDGNAYIVMELLDGEPLDQRLQRLGRLPLGSALRILRQVATSLAAAHRRGIIHRDIKPENIFLVRDPEVAGGERTKLLDFGIAKLSTDQRVKTHTSAVMGTPVFMSPEQCRGAGQVDHRSDLYSLGCVLFALLTGRPPFDADGAGEIIAMHLREPPPRPSTFLPGLPAAVDELVLRCLVKDREQRFQSGAELAAAVEAIAEQLTAQDPPRRPSTEAEISTVQRPPIAMTPIDTEPMPTPPQAAHPQAVPILPMIAAPMMAAPMQPPMQPSVSPNALAHLAQAVTMTPLPEPQGTPWPRPGTGPGTGPGGGQSAPYAIPRAATGEEPTAPFVPSSRPPGVPMSSQPAMPAVVMPSQPAMPAVALPPPVTLETRAAPMGPGASGSMPGQMAGSIAGAMSGQMSRPSQAGMTTLSVSAGSGRVAKKGGRRVGLIAGVVVVGTVVGIAAVTLSSGASRQSASHPSGVGNIDSGNIDSGLASLDAAVPEVASGAATDVKTEARIDAQPDAPQVAQAPPDAATAPLSPDAAVAPAAAPAASAAPATAPGAAEQALTAVHMRAVSTAFAKWAKDNQGKPCPSLASLGTLLDLDDARDGWGTPFGLSCDAQPSGHRIAILSAGPDRRFDSDDDIASWKVKTVAASLKGLRWGAVAETPAKPPKKNDKQQKPPASTNTTGMPTRRR